MKRVKKKMEININFMRNQNYNKLIYILRTHNLGHFDDQYLEKNLFPEKFLKRFFLFFHNE